MRSLTSGLHHRVERVDGFDFRNHLAAELYASVYPPALADASRR